MSDCDVHRTSDSLKVIQYVCQSYSEAEHVLYIIPTQSSAALPYCLSDYQMYFEQTFDEHEHEWIIALTEGVNE